MENNGNGSKIGHLGGLAQKNLSHCSKNENKNNN